MSNSVKKEYSNFFLNLKAFLKKSLDILTVL